MFTSFFGVLFYIFDVDSVWIVWWSNETFAIDLEHEVHGLAQADLTDFQVAVVTMVTFIYMYMEELALSFV